VIPASYSVRDSVIRPATVLAPMAGVTDTIFRRVIRGLGGCGLIMTEFTSAEGLSRQISRNAAISLFPRGRASHLRADFGADAKVMASAAGLSEELGFDFVDINLGARRRRS